MFELQVQGQFKRLPIGEIVVGGESTNKMELGLIMRSVCKAVCNFGSSIINDLHFSFGDFQSSLDYQLPHMSAPLFTTMDRVIVTPEKNPVPKMGEPFIEDPEYRKKRMKFKTIEDANIKLNNIYSFSVASSNIDFCKWCTVGIPMVRSMDLRTIWGDSDLRLGDFDAVAVILISVFVSVFDLSFDVIYCHLLVFTVSKGPHHHHHGKMVRW